MAVFLLRGIYGSGYTPPAIPPGGSTGFNDVPTSHWAAAWIKKFATEGITAGCSSNPPLYCPEESTTHAQMAIFLLRSKYGRYYNPPPATGTIFYDVPASHWAAKWIEKAAAEGIFDTDELINDGCDPGKFCPETPVSRALMAGWLVRTFNLP